MVKSFGMWNIWRQIWKYPNRSQIKKKYVVKRSYRLNTLYPEGRVIIPALFLSMLMVDGGDRVVTPGLDHPVHQLPLSGEGVELQDVIRVGTVITA